MMHDGQEIKILLEDPLFLVVEKPSGIPSQPLKDKALSLASLLAEKYPELRNIGGLDGGAVHRLDRETSGLMIFARTSSTYDWFREQFSKNKIEKEYTALVVGEISQPGKITWPIGGDPRSSKKVKVYKNIKEGRRHKAQEAVTFYEPLSLREGAWGKVTLVSIRIKTGRRHQIRAHMASIGHPLVGDRLYKGPEGKRLFLHASKICFEHPKTGVLCYFSSRPFSFS